MNKIDPKRLAEELQKARLLGKSSADVVRRLRDEAEAKISKKKDVPVGTKEGIPEKSNIFKKVASATQAIVSKGINNAKANPETISLRVLSCHGNDTLAACPRRMDSKKFVDSHFCGACGCGDKSLTQLSPHKVDGAMKDYTKLHIPKVTCPLKMPGFINYQSCVEDPKTANDRKQFIEFSESVESIKVKSNPT